MWWFMYVKYNSMIWYDDDVDDVDDDDDDDDDMWSSEKRLQAAQSYLWEVVFEIARSGSKRFRACCWTQLRNSSKRL